MNKTNPERDKIIVESLTTQIKSVGELGRDFGISRERVCQIYSRITGNPRGTLRKVKKHHNEMAIKFVCLGCSTPVTVKDGKYLHKYCRDCHKISQTSNRMLKLTFSCTHCGKKYHPLSISARNSVKKTQSRVGSFCSFQCYTDHGVKIGRPRGSKNRIKNAEEVGTEGNIRLQTI